MAKKSDAVVVNAILNALNVVKVATSFATPVKFSMKKLTTEYALPSTFSVVIKELKIVGQDDAEGGKKTFWMWTYGNGELNEDLALKILESVRKRYNDAKTDSRKAVKAKTGIPMLNEAPKAAEPVVAKTKEPKLDKPKAQPVAKKAQLPVVKRELPGVPFGFKQLALMKELFRKKVTVVTIDDYLSFKGVQLLTFKVEASKLVVSLWMYADNSHNPDQTSLIGEFTLSNQILALKEGVEDESTSNLLIYTIQVSDPYDVKL